MLFHRACSAALLSSLAVTGFFTQAALAGESAADWGGLYIGAHAGYAFEDTSWEHKSINPYSTTNAEVPILLSGESFSSDGLTGGGQIGANFQFNRIVAGVEVSYAAADLANSHAISPGVFNQPATSTVESRIDSLFTATARLGLTVGAQGLVYVKGGIAGGHINYKGTDSSGFNYAFSNSSWANGWTAGAGGEYKITSVMSVALEYAHIDLGQTSASGPIARLPDYPVNMNVKNEIDTVTVRLNFKP